MTIPGLPDFTRPTGPVTPYVPPISSSIPMSQPDMVSPNAAPGRSETWGSLGNYIGNLGSLIFESVVGSFAPGFEYDSSLGFKENWDNEEASRLTPTEVGMAVGNIGRGAVRTIEFLNSFLSPTSMTAKAQFAEGVMGAGNIITAPIRSFRDSDNILDYAGQTLGSTIPTVAVGMLEQFVTPMATATSGKSIVDGEIVPATSEEMATGLTTIAGNVLGGSIYNRLATAATVARTGKQINRMGTMARGIAIEARAQGLSGMAQEAVAHPDEFTMESVVNNVANPLVLATALGGGLLRGSRAIKKERLDWNAETADINTDAARAIPSAKQVAVTTRSTFAQSLAAIDALTTSSDWIEAGISKIRKAKEGTFYVLDATADDVRRLYDKYIGEPLVEKPTKVVPLNKVPVEQIGTRRNVHVYFSDPFDNIVYQADDLGVLADQYKIPKPVLIDHQAKLNQAVIDGKISNAPVGKQNFWYMSIDGIGFDPPKMRPRVYLSKNGTVLATMKPLTKTQFSIFEEAGFLPDERVVVNGVEVDFKSARNGVARVVGPDGIESIVDLADINHSADGTNAVWGKRDFEDNLVNRALDFVERKKSDTSTFSSLIERFAAGIKMDPKDIPSFENFVYNKARIQNDIIEKSYQPRSPSEVRFQKAFKGLNTILANEQKKLVSGAVDKMNLLGYRITQSGTGYTLVDYTGKRIAGFNTVDEAAKFANKDFFTGDVPTLLQGNLPFRAGFVTPRKQGAATKLSTGFKLGIVGQALRPIARRAEDLAEAAGVPELGVAIARGMEVTMNSINAAEQGIFKPLMDRANRISTLALKITREQREQVTRALQQMSRAEIAQMIGPDNVLVAESLYDFFKAAGGTEKVKAKFAELRDATPKNRVKLEASLAGPMRDAITVLRKSIADGVIMDDGILRYVDELENGSNLTQAEYIALQNWDRNALTVFEESQKLFEQARLSFGIEGNITGYAPWIQKWDGITSIYNRTEGPAKQFIHELQRLGLTGKDLLVTEIDDLVYRYVKSGVHYKSPVAGDPFKTTGQLMAEVQADIRELGSLGGEIADLETWVGNLKGIPDRVSANAQAAQKIIDKVFSTKTQGGIVDNALDAFTLLKLSARPILAARDVVTSSLLALGYGFDAAGAILHITPEKLRRIEQLSREGHLPQFDAKDILSRYEKTKLSKLVDLGMRASLQPQTYKAIAGNMYLHTFDKTMAALSKAKGNRALLIEELGDLLDSGSKPSQEYFLNMAQRDVVSAARFLAARNAGNLANRFGRLNNPLTWQSSYGRVFGQFGSWSTNALNTTIEMVTNSRSGMAAARKVARMGAFSAGVALVADEYLELDLSKWVLNPAALLPGVGPLAGTWDDFRQSIDMFFSMNEDTSMRGGEKVYQLTKGFITPIMLKDLYKAGEMWNDTGSQYYALMQALGFKFTEED